MCIRPQTYESAEEAEVLAWVYADRRGQLHNTSFGLLSSDGKRKLSRTGRSPSMAFGTPEAFLDALRELTEKEKLTRKAPIRGLPVIADLRLALDVATADLRPLVVLYSKKGKTPEATRTSLEALAWSEAFVGRLRYVVLEGEKSLEGFESLELEPGISVVEAETYARGGEVLSHTGPRSSADLLESTLSKGLEAFDAQAKNVRRHLRNGEREGIEWETAVPVSDPRAKR